MIKLLIIDALNLVRRIYSALPVQDDEAPDIARFLSACENAFKQSLNQHQPSHGVCVFEHYDTTWRHDLYPPYKANRQPQPQAMLESFPKLKVMLDALGIGCLDVKGYEADDIIASIVNTTHGHDCQNLILSTDHLMAQLLDENTRLYDHFNQRPIDTTMIFDRYAIRPSQLPDYFALVGSASVNVPGIAGVGAKTAAKLLTGNKCIEQLIHPNEPDAKTDKLLADKQHALYLYRALFRLRTDCPMNGNLKAWRVSSG